MTENLKISIAVSESSGAKLGGPQQLTDGSTVYAEPWGSACEGCGEIPAAGEQITKIFHAWYHALCGAKYLRETGADEAWLALGHQLERAPSKFSNAETKAITRNLLRMASRGFTTPLAGYSDTVRGSRATLRAVSGDGR